MGDSEGNTLSLLFIFRDSKTGAALLRAEEDTGVYKAAGRQRRKLYSAGSRGKRLFNENLPQRGQRYGRRPDRPVFRSERGDPESRRTSPIFFRQNCKIEPEKAVCSDRAYHSGQETDRCVRSQVEERGASGMRLFFVWRKRRRRRG